MSRLFLEPNFLDRLQKTFSMAIQTLKTVKKSPLRPKNGSSPPFTSLTMDSAQESRIDGSWEKTASLLSKQMRI